MSFEEDKKILLLACRPDESGRDTSELEATLDRISESEGFSNLSISNQQMVTLGIFTMYDNSKVYYKHDHYFHALGFIQVIDELGIYDERVAHIN